MTKSIHSTASRRQTVAGTPSTPEPSNFIDPTTLPDEYAMRVRGDCLAPAIKGGDAILVDQRQPYAVGDLVRVFLKPEWVAPGCTKRRAQAAHHEHAARRDLSLREHPDSNIMPVLVCEQDNPHLQYTIPADQILAVHRCMGRTPRRSRWSRCSTKRTNAGGPRWTFGRMLRFVIGTPCLLCPRGRTCRTTFSKCSRRCRSVNFAHCLTGTLFGSGLRKATRQDRRGGPRRTAYTTRLA